MLGWVNWIGNRYYTDPETGYLASGVTKVDEKPYFFGIKSNRVMYGIVNYEGEKYYTNYQGYLQTGMQNVGGKWYYFNDETYKAESGWKELDGLRYYFDEET